MLFLGLCGLCRCSAMKGESGGSPAKFRKSTCRRCQFLDFLQIAEKLIMRSEQLVFRRQGLSYAKTAPPFVHKTSTVTGERLRERGFGTGLHKRRGSYDAFGQSGQFKSSICSIFFSRCRFAAPGLFHGQPVEWHRLKALSSCRSGPLRLRRSPSYRGKIPPPPLDSGAEPPGTDAAPG